MWWIIGIVAGLVVVGVVAYFVYVRGNSSEAPLSIVFLRRSYRNIKQPELRQAFRGAFNAEPEIHALDGPHIKGGAFAVSGEFPPIAVIDCNVPYSSVEDLEHVLDRIEHPEARKAIAEHAAWFSVDALGIGKRLSKKERMLAYQPLILVAAKLFDGDSMMIYLPREERFGPGGSPGFKWLIDSAEAGEFVDTGLEAPVIYVEADDKKIKRAMKEAKMRLPEFCSAFERRGTACHGLIKAGFSKDDPEDSSLEYIWVEVTEATDSGFTGTIQNHPIAERISPMGSTVNIKLDDIVDWAYVDEKEEPHGMFVDRILLAKKR